MYAKIITCSCTIIELKKMRDVLQHTSTVFGCCTEKIPKYIATVCKKCPLNSYLFVRNYFSSANCSCINTNNRAYCNCLQDHLNYSAKKVCVEIYDIKNLPFEVVDFNKYLWDIKADPFFIFCKEFEFVNVVLVI